MSSPKAGSEEVPPKRPRVDDTLRNFLYFGLTFIWVQVSLEDPSNRIRLDSKYLPSALRSAIQNDIEKITDGGLDNYSSSGSRPFKRVNGTNIWLFQHEGHVGCSKVRYEHFSGALGVERLDIGSCSCMCLETRAPFHFMLEPYFRDNVSLCRLFTTILERGDLSEQVKVAITEFLDKVKVLLQSSPQNMPDKFSTGSTPDELGYIFDENIWSQRLTGCLKLFLAKAKDLRLPDVEMTGSFASQFKMKQKLSTGLPVTLCPCYMFHGAPDVTIGNSPIVVDPDREGPREEGEEPSSESEPEYIIENSLQAPPQREYPSKLGELLANMHIVLVKKILKVFVKKEKPKEMKLLSRGLLLHKATGGIICEMSVELKKDEPAKLKICIDDYVCETLNTETLCLLLQRLLNNKFH